MTQTAIDATTEGAANTAMASLVASLADNKAALGRRYGEWAISAPTLESAVAAAAMAQDELGHARATYPVLKALGAEVPSSEEASFGGDKRLALLDDELSDWAALIAANLLVDGILTTFVASCVDSSLPQMSQRARKILQEEGSHRVHAEAWGRRLCRSEPNQTERLLARIEETWQQAGRWAGPDDDPGVRAALEAGMFASAPSTQRALVRDWLVSLLKNEGVTVTLDEPSDWSSWDPERRRWTP